MPEHHPSLESILFIYDVEGILKINDKELLLKSGQARIIDPKLR